MKFIDAHNHLQDKRLAESREQIFKDLNQVSLQFAVVNGTEQSDWQAVIELSNQDKRFIPSLGLHPWFLRARSALWKEKLGAYLDSAKCGIGEIGLDRWMKDFDLAEQEELFIEQLKIAAERNLPVTIHCLKAWGRLLEILQAQKLPACGFLLHSYSGPLEMVEKFSFLGAYFSFSGYFAHERKEKQRDVFKNIPADRLLIETDAPDMLPPESLQRFRLPSPKGGELNHPANIASIYECCATLRGCELSSLVASVEKNFRRLFGGLLG